MESILEVNQVSKTFKDKKAVNRISFRIDKGDIIAILGPNGAGKTTAISMMLGLLEPTEGTIRLFGKPPKDRTVRERTGAMLQEVSVMDRLRVKEVLELVRSYYPNPLDMETLVRLTRLAEGDLKRFAEKLSGGQKRNLGFALAMAGNPDLLFFDEPTVGLDISARRRFWDRVRELAALGKTVIFTTHYLQEADDNADRILLFHQGSIVADGTPDEIKSRIVKRAISVLPRDEGPDLREKLRRLPMVSECYDKDGRIYLATEDTDVTLAALFAQNLGVRDIRTEQGRLDEAFEQLTLNLKEAK